MKISNKLPHFSVPTLLVACNATRAIFYLADKDEIEKVADFKIDKPEYSDREDYGRRPDGRVFESGARFEVEKQLLNREFKPQFLSRVKNLSERFGVKKFYLFTAKNLFSFTERIIPRFLRDKLVSHQKGDYTKDHVFRLLAMI